MSRNPTSQIKDPTAAQIMTSPGVVCRESAFVEEVAELLAHREISGVPVIDAEERVVGVISERDLARALGGPLIRLALRRPLHSGPFLREPRGFPPEIRRARDLMSSPPVVVRPETPMHALAEIMVRKEINRIPVVDRGRLVGIVTRGDVLAAVAGMNLHHVELGRAPVVVGAAPPA